jgi:hypothetical protein
MAISPALRGISLSLPRVKHGEGLLQHRRGRIDASPTKNCLPARSPALRGEGRALFTNLLNLRTL